MQLLLDFSQAVLIGAMSIESAVFYFNVLKFIFPEKILEVFHMNIKQTGILGFISHLIHIRSIVTNHTIRLVN